MKAALIVGPNSKVCGDLKAHMQSLGYVAVSTDAHGSALNVAMVTKFDLVLICDPTRPAERRSFAGELVTITRSAKVILVTSSDTVYALARDCRYSGITAVLRGPVTLTKLWRIIEYGLEGLGCHPGWVEAASERRQLAVTNAG